MYLEGGPGGAEPPRNLADQLTLFKPRGADYAPHTTASPPGFKTLSTPLKMMNELRIILKTKVWSARAAVFYMKARTHTELECA